MNFVNINGLIIEEDGVNRLKAIGLLGFDELMSFEGGEVIKDKKIRTVVRIDLGTELGSYYLKRFYSEGNKKKSLFSLKKNIEEAKHEWFNTVLLLRLGISTHEPICFGEVRENGIEKQALILTKGLDGTHKLDNYLQNVNFNKKREIIAKVANFARDFHSKGLNHQDFYLTHFLFNPQTEKLSIVDLQRVHRRPKVPKRYLIKDLAQMAFSFETANGVTKSDLMRFFHLYFAVEKLGRKEKKMLKRVFFKVSRIRRHTDKLIERMKTTGAKNI